MSRRIRDDLEGVVHVDGQVLKAGDPEPEGVTLGDHLFDVKPEDDKPKPSRAKAADK